MTIFAGVIIYQSKRNAMIIEKMKKEKRFHTKDELIFVDKTGDGTNPAVTGIIPEGYMTGEEFWRSLREQITKHYKENGLL